jgi:hypothetical protein
MASDAIVHEYTERQAVAVQLYQLYRLSRLNQLYYAERSQRLDKRFKWAELTIAISSSASLITVISNFPAVAVALSILTAVLSAFLLTFGVSRGASKYEALSTSYSQIFAALERIIADYRFEGHASDRIEYAFSIVAQEFHALSALQLPDRDEKLIDKHQRSRFTNSCRQALAASLRP